MNAAKAENYQSFMGKAGEEKLYHVKVVWEKLST